METTTVVIPSYRSEKTIYRTIDSVLKSKNIYAFVIVVEDGVFDDTANVVKKFNGIVRIESFQNNRGAQKARNHGLALVETETVMFLDSDDFIDEEILFSLHETIIKKDVSLAFGPYRFSGYFVGDRQIRYPDITGGRVGIASRWLKGKPGPGSCAVMWKTSEIRRVGGWDERIVRNQDGELVLRALRQGCEVGETRIGCGFYWQHDGDRVSTNENVASFKSQLLVFEQMNEWAEEVGSSELKDSSLYFIFNIAYKSFSLSMHNVGNEMIDKWKKCGGSYFSINDGGVKFLFKKILCKIFGFKYGYLLIEQLRKFIC